MFSLGHIIAYAFDPIALSDRGSFSGHPCGQSGDPGKMGRCRVSNKWYDIFCGEGALSDTVPAMTNSLCHFSELVSASGQSYCQQRSRCFEKRNSRLIKRRSII